MIDFIGFPLFSGVAAIVGRLPWPRKGAAGRSFISPKDGKPRKKKDQPDPERDSSRNGDELQQERHSRRKSVWRRVLSRHHVKNATEPKPLTPVTRMPMATMIRSRIFIDVCPTAAD